MNWAQVSGKWDQVKGDIKSNWGKLTDDDLAFIGGKLDNLVGKLVERYGVKKEQAERQIDQWAARLGDKIDGDRVATGQQDRPGDMPGRTPKS
jgi:uncharacterized protein YjbJ (UPF0337 family)